jgi:hypothetical protein
MVPEASLESIETWAAIALVEPLAMAFKSAIAKSSSTTSINAITKPSKLFMHVLSILFPAIRK